MTGACVTTRERLTFSDKHLIKFHGGGTPFTLSCHVIWETTSIELTSPTKGSDPVYKAGVAFNDTASDKMITLKDFIRVSGTPNQQRLSDEYGSSALRFQVQANEKVLLYYPRISYVKKISLGGMLIGSDSGIQVEKRFPMAVFLANENLPLKFEGRVVCCIEIADKKSKSFDIGIEFLDMSIHDKSRLSRFLQTLTITPLHKKILRLFRKAVFLPRTP
jgi:hypothetical protein